MAIGDYAYTGTTITNAGDRITSQWTTTTDNTFNIGNSSDSWTTLSWYPKPHQFTSPIYRNETKLSELTKTMGSIISITEALEKKKIKGVPVDELIKHLNNYLVTVTRDFMEESQKPQGPEQFTITATGAV